MKAHYIALAILPIALPGPLHAQTPVSGLAARKGVSPEEVGITAACSLLRRIGVGEYYLLGQSGWQRYAPGRSPVPSYCG